MKVPKTPGSPSGPSSAAEKDKTITRRSVKGAAGGMKGVDYEDDRRPDEGEAATIAAGTRARALVREAKAQEYQPPRPAEDLEKNRTVPRDPAELVLYEEELSAEEARKKQRRKQQLARDRFSVDKDAPELLRKKRWADDEEEEDAEDAERADDRADPPDLDLDLLGELVGGDPLVAKRRAELFNPEERPEPGDPSLTDPDEIQRALGSPVAFAKHAMILGEAFRRATGATRDEAVSYLAKMFVATSDRAFGRLALKELGPSTGIIDVYPLEVVEHVLTKYPGFLPKAGFGRFFSNLPDGEGRQLHTDTKTPVLLEYPAELKIRGFALSGGGRPGYTFEPDVEPGRYRLHIQTPGRYTVLVSCVTKSGHTLVERLGVRVRAKTIDALELPGETTVYPERDAAKVSAWPVPTPEPVPIEELFEADDRRSQVLTTGERVRMQLLDALRGPQPEAREYEDEEPRLMASAALPDEDAEILREAVAAALELGGLELPAEVSAELGEVDAPPAEADARPVRAAAAHEDDARPVRAAAAFEDDVTRELVREEPTARTPEPAPARTASLPGERASSLPGERASSLPGERAASLPGERASSLPGERAASASSAPEPRRPSLAPAPAARSPFGPPATRGPSRAPALPTASRPSVAPGFAPPALRFDDEDDEDDGGVEENTGEITLTEQPVASAYALEAAGPAGADATQPVVRALGEDDAGAAPELLEDDDALELIDDDEVISLEATDHDDEPPLVVPHGVEDSDARVVAHGVDEADALVAPPAARRALEDPSPAATLPAFTSPVPGVRAGGPPSPAPLDLAADLLLDAPLPEPKKR